MAYSRFYVWTSMSLKCQ